MDTISAADFVPTDEQVEAFSKAWSVDKDSYFDLCPAAAGRITLAIYESRWLDAYQGCVDIGADVCANLLSGGVLIVGVRLKFFQNNS